MRVAGVAIALVVALVAGAAPARRVAFTFDDLPGLSAPCDIAAFQHLNQKLIDAIARNKIPATGLVVESRICPEQRHRIRQLYQLWLDAGLELGNHTHSHRDLNTTPIEEYQADVVAGERTLRPLVESRGQRLRYFRYPYLRSGMDLPKKRAFETFLRQRGYTNAPVTIDDDEYIYAAVYDRALRDKTPQTARRIADDYARYMDSIFAFHEKLSRDALGYELPQILLLHVNRLNADHLDRLTHIARQRGYRFISLEEALRDKAYSRVDGYTGQRGLSWLHRWMLDDGKKPPPHPEVPTWVMKLYRAL